MKNRIEQIRGIIEGKLKRYYGRALENASDEEMFQVTAMSIRDIMLERGVLANETVEKKGHKRLCYLSAEFLMGRALVNNLINLGLLAEYRAVMADILSLIHISEPTRLLSISYAVFCLKKKKTT